MIKRSDRFPRPRLVHGEQLRLTEDFGHQQIIMTVASPPARQVAFSQLLQSLEFFLKAVR